MKKISTLYKKGQNNLGRVINELAHEWAKQAVPTRKFDGSACAIFNDNLYKRYDAKRGKPAPVGAIPCQEPDEHGHWPHWVLCDRSNPADQYFWEAYDKLAVKATGSYELCGPKIQGNPEKFDSHVMIMHGCEILELESIEFEYLRQYLTDHDIEGIVFWGEGQMCKIRKSDFGIKR